MYSSRVVKEENSIVDQQAFFFKIFILKIIKFLLYKQEI